MIDSFMRKHLSQYGFITMMMSSLLCSKIITADMSPSFGYRVNFLTFDSKNTGLMVQTRARVGAGVEVLARQLARHIVGVDCGRCRVHVPLIFLQQF
jgi:hypothetical protein